DPGVSRGLDRVRQGFGLRNGLFGFRNGGPELCLTGNTARMFIQLGRGDIPHVKQSLDWLADTQLEDGGWDCFGRKKGTLDCWEALSAYAALGVKRLTKKWKRSAERGAEFYLERGLLNEGGSIWAGWKRIHYPNHYYYDFLVGLEILTLLGYGEDPRLRPALAMLRKKRRPDRTWAIDKMHPDLPPGHGYRAAHSKVKAWAATLKPQIVEAPRTPSKWITLRALGVLKRVG
ncbi:MAG TPA: prenyltransferase/squalene oxidase repeat-containing protein, partial [Thermoplasmata archaeon]|nr:prenyltransferase/squalene oxidase repeat-containing protein [Thermoplasmata archaeon]